MGKQLAAVNSTAIHIEEGGGEVNEGQWGQGCHHRLLYLLLSEQLLLWVSTGSSSSLCPFNSEVLQSSVRVPLSSTYPWMLNKLIPVNPKLFGITNMVTSCDSVGWLGQLGSALFEISHEVCSEPWGDVNQILLQKWRPYQSPCWQSFSGKASVYGVTSPKVSHPFLSSLYPRTDWLI